MTNRNYWVVNNKVMQGTRVQLSNGEYSSVNSIGTHFFYSSRKLRNVFYVPDFKYNLLSVSKLTKGLNCSAKFYPNFAILQDLSNGRVLGNDKEDYGLYFFKPSCNVVESVIYDSVVNNVMTWQTFTTCGVLIFSKNKTMNVYGCPVCPKAKFTRKIFPYF